MKLEAVVGQSGPALEQAQAHLYRGQALFELDQQTAAVAELRQALNLAPQLRVDAQELSRPAANAAGAATAACASTSRASQNEQRRGFVRLREKESVRCQVDQNASGYTPPITLAFRLRGQLGERVGFSFEMD